MNPKGTTSQFTSSVQFRPATRIVLFIASFTTPGLRALAQAICADDQSSSLLSVFTHMECSSVRLMVDELDAVAANLGYQVPALLRPTELDRMAVTLMFLRSCYQNAEEANAFLLSAWDDTLRLQLRVLHKSEPSLDVLLRHILGMGNEDDLELQGIKELRLRIRLGLEGVHRRYPQLAAYIQNHLSAVNTLHD